MQEGSVTWWKRLAMVFASVAASSLTASWLEPYIEGQAQLLPFILAIIASAWYGGLAAGLGATILSFLIADYFFIDPRFQLHPFSAFHAALFLLYLVVGIAISVLKAALARSNAVLRATVDRLDAVTARYELAAQHGSIGFQDYLVRGDRQIWTPEMEQLFGLAPGTFEGSYHDWMKRVHPDDRERIARERQHCIERRQADWTYEYRAVLPDGSYRWLEGRSRLYFTEAGELYRILGAAIDITERRNLEQSLRDRSDQLAKANQELDRFSYMVSHDLQEPLRGISTMTELFVRRNRGVLDPDSTQLLEFAVDSARRMKRLIADILELAHAGSNTPLATAEVDADAVARIAILELKALIDESGARITADPLPMVQANESQLLRLFLNLIGNGIKYRGERPPEVHLSARPAGEQWEFCVRDNGMGIDPMYQKQIFDAFRRLHDGAGYEGTGLGLAICKRIVEKHNGRLWVESEVNRGARFYFTLPKPVPAGSPAAMQRAPEQAKDPYVRRSHSAGR